MTRYQLIFSKTGVSHTLGADDMEQALRMAEGLRKGGFHYVEVWAHTGNCDSPTKL